MSITPITRLVASIIVFLSMVVCLAMLSRSDAGPSPASKAIERNPAAYKPPLPKNFNAQSNQRELDDKLPKHLPITVHLKKEKEKSFGELENEKWVRDFEVEVKNTGKKPIYFIRLALIPEMGKAPSERTLSLTVQYGRDELVSFDTALTPNDVPIQPGEKVSLSIRPEELNGWDHFKRVEQWPAAWSKPKKATLMFEILNFGDGTGFDGGEGVPRQGKKPDKTTGQAQPKSAGQEASNNQIFPWRLPKEPSNTTIQGCKEPTSFLSAFFASAAPAEEPLECNCYEGCEYVAPAVYLLECHNCPPLRRVTNVNCLQSGSCKKVRHLERICWVMKDDDDFWVACPWELETECTPPAPTPTPTPSATPTPIPCPITNPGSCPSGIAVDPCTYNNQVPPEFANGCPIFWKPGAPNPYCCVPDCYNQPTPPPCDGNLTWVDSDPPFCYWLCLPVIEFPSPPPPAEDPCELDPFCCLDPCCGDACCDDPNCGLDCFEICYVIEEQFCGVWDYEYNSCSWWDYRYEYVCDVYCY